MAARVRVTPSTTNCARKNITTTEAKPCTRSPSAQLMAPLMSTPKATRFAACTVPAARFCAWMAALTEKPWKTIQSLTRMPSLSSTSPSTPYATTATSSAPIVTSGSPCAAPASTKAAAKTPPASARPKAKLSFSANSSRESTLNSIPEP